MAKLQIFVRHAIYSDVSKHKKRPSYFSRKNCYLNLLQTLPSFAKLTFVLDTYYGDIEDHFLAEEKNYPVITNTLGTEAKSFLFLLDYIKAQKLKDDTIIYLLEDDYLHRENWGRILFDGFSNKSVEYLTLYDHFDKYDKKLYPTLSSEIIAGKYSHFRTTPSTTNTFAVRWKTLREDISIHQKFSERRSITQDHQKFVHLNEKGRKIFSSLPGYSTHMEEGLLSPYVNWRDVGERKKRNWLDRLRRKATY